MVQPGWHTVYFFFCSLPSQQCLALAQPRHKRHSEGVYKTHNIASFQGLVQLLYMQGLAMGLWELLCEAVDEYPHSQALAQLSIACNTTVLQATGNWARTWEQDQQMGMLPRKYQSLSVAIYFQIIGVDIESPTACIQVSPPVTANSQLAQENCRLCRGIQDCQNIQ